MKARGVVASTSRGFVGRKLLDPQPCGKGASHLAPKTEGRRSGCTRGGDVQGSCSEEGGRKLRGGEEVTTSGTTSGAGSDGEHGYLTSCSDESSDDGAKSVKREGLGGALGTSQRSAQLSGRHYSSKTRQLQDSCSAQSSFGKCTIVIRTGGSY